MKLTRLILGVLVFSLVPLSGWGEGGSTAANILQLPVGARAIGMGEAYTAQADDISSLYWNPAGLAFMNQAQASFLYNQMYQGINYSYGSVGIPLENGGLGASLSYLGYGNIPGYDTTGNPIGNQNASAEVATFGGAMLSEWGGIGITAKGIQENLAGNSATGIAFDAGGTLVLPHPLLDGTVRLGAVIQNLGPDMKFLQQSDPLPEQWKVGAAVVELLDKKLNLSADIGEPRDTPMTIEGGAEYWLFPCLALRTGYARTWEQGSGLRAGIGIRIRSVDFNYAYAGYGDLGMVQRYELTYHFGETRPILTPEERKLLKQAKVAIREHRYETAFLLLNSLHEMEPAYKPARKLMDLAMRGAEDQDRAFANQWRPVYLKPTEQESPAETDDLIGILDLDTPKAAQATDDNIKTWAQPPAASIGAGAAEESTLAPLVNPAQVNQGGKEPSK